MAPMTREQVVADIVEALRQDFNRVVDMVQGAARGQVIESVEFDVREMAHAMYARLLQAAVELREKLWERTEAARCPSCGKKMRMVNFVEKQLMSVVGEMRFERRYYHCGECKVSRVPFDEAVGIEGHFTKGAKRLIALSGVQESFEQAAKHLKELAALRLSKRTVRTITQQAARKAEGEQQAGRPILPAGPAPLAGEARGYVACDATKANTIQSGWRDIKLAVLYDQSVQRKYFVAGLQPAEEFGLTLRRHAAAVGLWDVVEKIAAGDGADWIWKQFDINLPIIDHQVLDYYHLCENIYKAAWRMYPEGSDAGRHWALQKAKLALGQGGRALLKLLRTELKRDKRRTHRQAMQGLLDYLTKHEDRMDYPQLQAKGIHIGTGILESGCKNVIGKRLKGRGMRWLEQNVAAMACLRTVLASTGCWDRFWDTVARAA